MLSLDELKKKAIDEFGEMITEIISYPDGGINVHIVGGLFKYFSPSGGTSRLLSYDGKEFSKPTIKESTIRLFGDIMKPRPKRGSK